MACPVFRPDHNGECLTCDEWADAHTPAAVAAGEALATVHYKLASDCWALIRSIRDPEDPDYDRAAINLIRMACDSAAESERVRLGRRPKGS